MNRACERHLGLERRGVALGEMRDFADLNDQLGLVEMRFGYA